MALFTASATIRSSVHRKKRSDGGDWWLMEDVVGGPIRPGPCPSGGITGFPNVWRTRRASAPTVPEAKGKTWFGNSKTVDRSTESVGGGRSINGRSHPFDLFIK